MHTLQRHLWAHGANRNASSWASSRWKLHAPVKQTSVRWSLRVRLPTWFGNSAPFCLVPFIHQQESTPNPPKSTWGLNYFHLYLKSRRSASRASLNTPSRMPRSIFFNSYSKRPFASQLVSYICLNLTTRGSVHTLAINQDHWVDE